MTALDPTSLLSQAEAAITARRSGFTLSDEQRAEFALQFCNSHEMPEDQEPDPCGACEVQAEYMAPLIEAIVSAALAAATDHAESVLMRHAPWRCCEDHDFRCRTCAPGDDWPCPDARDALTALGIVVE
jgi:hypothetical protein